MSDFLVLGLIPGTPIQITFALWIFGVIAAVAFVLLYFGKRAHVFRNSIITTMVVVAMRQEPIKLNQRTLCPL